VSGRIRWAIAAAILCAAASPTPEASGDSLAALHSQMDAARAEIIANLPKIQHETGTHLEILARLVDDESMLEPNGRPDWMPERDYADEMKRTVELDVSLADQLSTGRRHALSEVRGSDEILFTSPADRTLQSMAVYVPSSYVPGRPTPLVVLLHGRLMTDGEMIVKPVFRDLADSNGCIIIAPYARGDAQYADPASVDVYAALDLVEGAFTVDVHHVYLAGYSMGGYGVFTVGIVQPNRWAAILSIAGAIPNEVGDLVVFRLRSKPFYLVSGTADANVPNSHVRAAVKVLRASGIEAGYYAQQGGTHHLETIIPAIGAAWSDMLKGRSPAGAELRFGNGIESVPQGMPATNRRELP